MNLTATLRKLLISFPWVFRALNRILPDPVLRRLRSAAEKLKYRDVTKVHDLPPVFHYWSQTYVRPILSELGYNGLPDFFLQHILRFTEESPIRLLSLGAGNCEADLALVAQLKKMGHKNICYECIELNSRMLQRARERATDLEITELMVFTELDVEDWEPSGRTRQHIIICRQFLHHVPDLETLMLKVKQAMAPGAYFLVDDMIGRNGHMRWPEALSLVEELWSELPESYKYHNLHGVTDTNYRNWDCSTSGFEGIRAQDILPLLLQHFQFDTFIAFANIIDVFVERPYGPNFDIGSQADLAFIDRVQAIDHNAIESGKIKPTHLIAAMQLEPVSETKTYRGLMPQHAVRIPHQAYGVE